MQVLTPSGYVDVSALSIGDAVLAYDTVTGEQIVNHVTKIEELSPGFDAINDDDGNTLPYVWKWVLVNGTHVFYRNQSVWANGNITRCESLVPGDVIYDDGDDDIVVSTVEELTGTNSTTLPDADILMWANAYLDTLQIKIVNIDEDYFLMRFERDLVAGQRQYSFPAETLGKVKSVEAMLDGSRWRTLREFDLPQYRKPNDEGSIRANFAGRVPMVDLRARSLVIYSGDPIVDVTGGLVRRHDRVAPDGQRDERHRPHPRHRLRHREHRRDGKRSVQRQHQRDYALPPDLHRRERRKRRQPAVPVGRAERLAVVRFLRPFAGAGIS